MTEEFRVAMPVFEIPDETIERSNVEQMLLDAWPAIARDAGAEPVVAPDVAEWHANPLYGQIITDADDQPKLDASGEPLTHQTPYYLVAIGQAERRD